MCEFDFVLPEKECLSVLELQNGKMLELRKELYEGEGGAHTFHEP